MKSQFFAIISIILLPASAAEKPNILLIVSDDQGYADVGFHGCKDIPTPNLDKLAESGIRFTNGYVSHAFCSPSRAGLMTGRCQQRFGHENNPYYDPNDHREGLPTSEKLLPQFLHGAGYATGWIGKWHLGAAPEFRPENRGFSETFGFLGGGHHYLNWKPNLQAGGQEYNEPILRNGKPVEVKNHLTIAFGEEGADFVRRHESDPWFLYLAFNAPHTPNEPTAERLARFKDIKNKKRRAYAAQVSLLDDAIGNVLAALRETKQDKRTLVFFFSDNGGQVIPEHWAGSSNLPLREGKGTVFEGGVRVPFVMSWPGKLAAGTTEDRMVSSLDVFPTALAMAGVEMPTDKTYDGVNLLPYLEEGKSSVIHNELFWRLGGGKQLAARAGDMKLVRIKGEAESLFDLEADLPETVNLAEGRANDAKRLGGLLDTWNATLVPPAFPGLSGKRTPEGKAKP